MNMLEAQAQKIAEALQKKPELMFEVLGKLQSRTLSPWTLRKPQSKNWFTLRDRCTPSGGVAATIWMDEDDLWHWVISIECPADKIMGLTDSFKEAQEAADERLHDAGWLLP